MRLDHEGDDDGGGINLTPMVDVVFLLLIFFLAATTFRTDEVSLDMKLPTAKSGDAGKGEKPLVVNLLADGRLHVDGREVTFEALRQKLQAAGLRSAEQAVLVRGDQQAQFGLGVQILDACRLAKIKKVDFAAQPVK